MRTLAEAQNSFASALRSGPDALSPTLLDGNAGRNLLAMAAYANTISHARLVALEDIFPTCRSAMGESAFNAASRAYVDAGNGVHGPLDAIGDAFPDWLDHSGKNADLVAIARFDLAFLAAYHAPDIPVIQATELPTDLEQLLAIPLARHPAASAHAATPLLCTHAMAEAPGASALLLTRAELTVRCTAIDVETMDVWRALAAPVTFGDLMTKMAEDYDDDTAAHAIINLMTSGGMAIGE